MASKEKTRLDDEAGINVEEVLEEVEKLLERTKVLYEQYFLGIQKLPPAQLHKDIDRKMRELTQVQIRNTAHRYRLATISQKFGSYNTYWKRTLREIEQGRYIRDVARVGRKAVARGEEIPAEILHAMPKRMREKILRDREAVAKRVAAKGPVELDPAVPSKPKKVRPVNRISEEESLLGDDVDLDAMFANLTSSSDDIEAKQAEPAAPAAPMRAQATPPPMTAAAPARATMPPTAPPKSTMPPVPARATVPPVPPAKPAVPNKAAPPTTPKPAAPLPPAPKPPGSPPAAPKAASAPAPAKAVSAPAPAKAASAPAPAKPAAAPKPDVSLPPGMTEREGRELYKRYVTAQEAVGDKTPTSYEGLMKSLNGKAPKILSEHGASKVSFNVVVKDNKVVLKAKPIK